MTSTEPKVYKIISATSSADANGQIRTRTIQHASNGEIIIRTGDVGARMASASPSSPRIMEKNGTRYTEIVKGQQTNYASDDKEAQQAKNASYRQSSFKNYLADDNQTKDATHTIYTKHSTSSAMLQHEPHDVSFQAFSTRRVTTNAPSSAAENSYEIRAVSNNVKVDKDVSRKSGVISTDIPDGPTNGGNKHLVLKEQKSNGGTTFVPSPTKNKCFNCSKTVYPKEKIGPNMDTVYHLQCFKCATCGFKLSLTNFYHNHNDVNDKRVYCKSHQPVVESSKGDIEDTNIRAVINKPKLAQMDTNIRRSGDLTRVSSIDSTALNIRTAMNVPKLDTYNQTVRPVPALATSPSSDEPSNPTAYMSRQVKNAEFHRPPSPPSASERITRL